MTILTLPRQQTLHASPVLAGASMLQGTSLYQRTLATAATCTGVGVHSGENVTLRLLPAPVNHGVVFVRTDLVNGARTIPALWNHVVDTKLCTVIANPHGGRVATIEHLMAAIYAYGLDNLIIEINGNEAPVMDGSSDHFVAMIEDAGIVDQNAARRFIEVLKPVEILHNGKRAALTPSAQSRYSINIDFDRAPIHRQSYELNLSANGFKQEISRARTFGFYEEVEQMQAAGFGRGGSLENAIVIKDDQIMNEDGLRYKDEFVRHKLLDAVGDLALAGAPIRGHFHGSCSGHAMNNQLLRALFVDATAWQYVTPADNIQLAANA